MHQRRNEDFTPVLNQLAVQNVLFRGIERSVPRDRDWLAERGEFELPVPIFEQSDDGIS